MEKYFSTHWGTAHAQFTELIEHAQPRVQAAPPQFTPDWSDLSTHSLGSGLCMPRSLHGGVVCEPRLHLSSTSLGWTDPAQPGLGCACSDRSKELMGRAPAFGPSMAWPARHWGPSVGHGPGVDDPCCIELCYKAFLFLCLENTRLPGYLVI